MISLIRLSVLLSLLFFSLSTHAQADRQDIENKYRLALSYEQAGQFEKAETIYRELQSLETWNQVYLDALNKILVRQKKYDESILLLETKIKEIPADVSLYGMLGTTYYMMDNIQKAYESWERGININPNTYVPYRVIANYAIENRLFDKAIEILKRGKAFSGDPVIFSFDLANIYSLNMRFEEAAEEYCTLVSAKPEQSGIVKSRFQNYFGKPGAAESTIKVIKEFAERNSLPVFNELLSFAYSLSGMYDEAFENIIEYDRKINGGGNYIFAFVQEAYRNRQYDIASKGYRYIIQNYKQSPLVQIAEIGLVRTLEDNVNLKVKNNSSGWKLYGNDDKKFEEEYSAVIVSYERLAKIYPDNASFIEATFRMAEIYFRKLNQFYKADSLYNLVISKSPYSRYTSLSYLGKGEIAMKLDRLDEAVNLLIQSGRFSNAEPDVVAQAKLYLGLVYFWKGDFNGSINILKELLQNLNSDPANDAIEYSSLITLARKDSLNLLTYAKADRLLFQNKPKESAIEFKTLADNSNLFVINEFAKYKLAEILISEENFFEASKILEELSDELKAAIFADKSTLLLGMTYQFGLNDPQRGAAIYQKLLEKFPNSLYFDTAREYLNSISIKNGNK
ncbi:MAG TPA: tetratricopeptide repeat protein [Melioribacteraceae bacterium]|nr:tetratricopeptide repeat protein [Melioribacteraceae bacterium]